MKPWADLYDAYLRDVSECTYVTAGDACRIAAQAFFERTRAWRADLLPVSTIANVGEYVFPLALDVELVRVESAKLGGQPVPIIQPENVTPGVTGVVVRGLRTFTLYPAPPAGQAIVFNVALEPSNTAAGLDDVMYSKYARIIAIGAKAHLLAMSHQPFSDIAMAAVLRMQFDSEINNVISDAGRGYSSAPKRTVAHFC